MALFDYQPRTRVLFGPGRLAAIGEAARALGGRRALIVSDPGIVAAGYPRRAAEFLAAAGLETFLFSDLEHDPTTKHVEAGLAFAREQRIDFLIGLGGGSSMDCAKGVNFLLTNVGKASKPMLPLIAVPTTAGTGSEAQSFALIADSETHQKMACGDPKAAAAVAILDPELTLTQPPSVTAVTAIDAISHALETWVTKKRNAPSLLFSQEAWRRLSGSYERVLDAPDDVAARGEMLLGAHWAGMAIENSMLGAAHSCANPLTAHYGVLHGAAVGLMLPAVIRFNAETARNLYNELAVCSDGAQHLAGRVEKMLDRAGLPRRLSRYDIPKNALPALAEEASRQWTAQFNPRPVGAKELLEIYRCVY